MEKQSEIMTQYGKIHTLYKTIVYLQKEIIKEFNKDGSHPVQFKKKKIK